MSQGYKKNAKATNNVSQLIFKYLAYWPLFLVISAICIAWSWYKLQHQTPLYHASIKILIKDQSSDSKIIEELSAGTPKNDVENQIEVIKSLPLMTQVVKNLGLYAPLYEEGKFIPRTAYQTSPITVIVNNPDSVVESDRVYFKYDKSSQQVILNNTKFPLNTWVNTKHGTLKFLPNKNYNGSVDTDHPLYFSLVHPQNLAASFAGGLDISIPKMGSSILFIGLVDEAPKRAEDILNELMVVYNKASIEEKNKLAANTLAFVEDRLKFVSQDLDTIERRIQQFRASKSTYDLTEQGRFYLSNVATYDKNIEEINMQLSVLKELEGFVLSSNGRGGIPSTFGIDDPVLAQLIERLYNSQIEMAKLKESMGENHPSLSALNLEITRLRPNILEHIRSHRNSLITSRSNLSSLNSSYTGKIASMPQKERELFDINREQAIKNNIYTFLLQKREETALSYASTVPDSRVLTSAGASWVPISPNPKKTYMMSIVFAFALAIGLIMAKEMFSKTVLYRHEIESMTVLPIVGEIAFNKSKNALINNVDSKSFLPTNFRKLRASLTFLGVGSKRKKVLVTSTIPGEGKSFVAANLGLSMALAGKKVILLEFDLVNPTLSNKLNIYEENGLTNYLNGEMEPEEIIRKSDVHENLFVIAAGPLPDNPTEMILSTKVQDLLNYLDGLFDSIIIDTAPVGPMTDAYVLSSYCDATLYVVRHHYTPKALVERIDEENKINQLKNAAIVFNAVKKRGFGNNYEYGYSYSYGGHKYLANDKDAGKRKRLVHKKA